MSGQVSQIRATTLQAVRRVAARSADIVRRMVRSLPAPVRTRLRGVADWCDRRGRHH